MYIKTRIEEGQDAICILQHTETQCITLQQTATHCNKMQHSHDVLFKARMRLLVFVIIKTRIFETRKNQKEHSKCPELLSLMHYS